MLYQGYKFTDETLDLTKRALEMCKAQFEEINSIQEYNQQKMLMAFQKARVSESFFFPSTGYGYDDRGREALDEIFAFMFNAEDALVRHNFVCGTHALTVALFGILRPGDKMLCVTGKPYDTLLGVIGSDAKADGSLADFGISFDYVPLDENGKPDYDAIEKATEPDIKMIYIQRSIGYALRPSLLNSDIEHIVKIIRKKAPNAVVMLDNCYGEFTEYDSPIDYGVDLMAGSLIKNAGGGIAPTGGYIAGKKELVEKCSYRLTTPGIGREVGATMGLNRELFMGAFNAPQVTGESLKTAIFAAALFKLMGFKVMPEYDEKRGDIIQAVITGDESSLISFCKGIQQAAPVDSFVTPEPCDMPGYDSKIIMAAGAFTLGATSELSADAPLREPYAAFLQGGLNFNSAKLGIMLAADAIIRSKE
ncbi:MAG: methionine gamma-lyase family protein [Clostridia bacterium]|nr:methionine gamma-lyase family protein [Clostridia bacterium]